MSNDTENDPLQGIDLERASDDDLRAMLSDLSERASTILLNAAHEDREPTPRESRRIEKLHRASTLVHGEIEARKPHPNNPKIRADGIPVMPADYQPKPPRSEQPIPQVARLGILLPANIARPSDLLFSARMDAWGSKSEDFFRCIANRMPDSRLLNSAGYEGIGESGGFSVPGVWFRGLIDQALQAAEFAPRCKLFPTDGAGLVIPAPDYSNRQTALAGLQANWVNEGSTQTAQHLKWRQVEIKLAKIFILAEASGELVADGVNYADQLTAALSAAAAYSLDGAILGGSGTGQPLGIINSNSAIQVAAESGQAAATLLFDNIVNMYARLAPSCQKAAVWFINPGLVPQLLRMSFPTSGGSTVPVLLGSGNPTNALAGEMIGTILGRPVCVSEVCAQPGQPGDICFADMSQYALCIRSTARIEMDLSPGFSRDVMSWRLILRVNGVPLWNSPITPYSGGATLGWAAYLAERS